MAAFRTSPVNGKPGGAGSKFLRVDVTPGTVFESLIETKTPRLGWARATRCPCAGYNDQTDQADPVCESCNGLGWLYFRPEDYCVDTAELGKFTAEQKAALEKANAQPIRGLLTSISQNPDMFRALGNWAFGSTYLTVRPGNRIGYYDRIIQIDEEAPYVEVILTDGSGILKTRYHVNGIHDLRSLTQAFGESDVKLVAGVVQWCEGKEPAAGTRVSIHYAYHPVWVAVEHPHLTRATLVKFRRPTAKLQTPEGDVVPLPTQTLLRLEFLDLTMRSNA